jgi:hypothetical protein
MSIDGKAIAYGALFLAAVAVALAGHLITPPAATPPRPIPAIKPMDMGRHLEEMIDRQQSRDLNSLGKIGPEHDAWILKRYQKPAPAPQPAKPPDTRVRPRPLIFQTT